MSKPWDKLRDEDGFLADGSFETPDSAAFINVKFEPTGVVIDISRQIVCHNDARVLAEFLLVAADQLEQS